MAMKIVLTESQFKRLIKEDEEPKKPVFSKEKWLYEPTNYKPIKKGEQWFYEPFNQCLRNLAEREKNVILAGHTACYENDFGDNICYEARFSKDDKGGYMRTPSFFKKYSYAVQLSLNEYLEPGEWWCEAGRKEPKVDLSIVDPNETTDIKWIGLGELDEFTFAFNHDKKILKYVNG